MENKKKKSKEVARVRRGFFVRVWKKFVGVRYKSGKVGSWRPSKGGGEEKGP